MDREIEYHTEFYDVSKGDEQWIRLTDGCYRDCWNCYCPKGIKVYDLPEINRNKVRFLDMNFLHAHHNPIDLLDSLPRKLNNKVIRYFFYCGLDFTLFTVPIVEALKKARVGRFNNKGNFINGISIAWDREINEKDAFIRAIGMLKDVGYKNNQARMLCNGKIPMKECFEKLKILKDLRVMIDDCWFDNQKRGSVKPIHWTERECEIFGNICRSHNVALMQRQYRAMDYLYGLVPI